MRKFEAFQESGKQDEAVEVLRELLVTDSEDHEAAYRLATIRAAQGASTDALELLRQIPAETPDYGVAALGLSAQLLMKVEQFSDVERLCRKALEIDSKVNAARHLLVYLFNRQGRRHEAVGLVHELCLSGDVTEEELQSLIVESNALYLDPDTQPQAGQQPYWPIGSGARARHLWTHASYPEAAAALEDAVVNGSACASDKALYGAALAESQQYEKLEWWLGDVGDGLEGFPEYWSAVGVYQLSQGKFRFAIRAFAEAIARDATDLRSIRRMATALRAIGEVEMAEQWTKRFEQVSLTLEARLHDARGQRIVVENLDRLTVDLGALGRNLEAILWMRAAALRDGGDAGRLQNVDQIRQHIITSGQTFPGQAVLLCGLNPEDFPLPHLPVAGTQGTQPPGTEVLSSTLAVPRFVNQAADYGMTHAYRVETSQRENAFTIYQSFGGGVAVLDYDLNGDPDLYYCQGDAVSPDFVAQSSDVLYRNTVRRSPQDRSATTGAHRSALNDVTDPAGIRERSYSLGVTAGDWNQDGFPDLVVANIGSNMLLINQGDGTFQRQPLDADPDMDRLSTSVAMADLDGDHLPDIYVLNYVDDPEFSVRPPLDDQGRPEKPVDPFTLTPARDEVWFNGGDGQWHHSYVGTEGMDESTGLGLVVSDVDAQPGNEIFVANDERADQLWRFDRQQQQWDESGVLSGCAFGSHGNPLGSMGVAAADFDGSGTLDLHVTTFYRESSCHLLNIDQFFRDMNVRYGIDRLSIPWMGFGCQAIDYSNRGVSDLVVANGDVEDVGYKGESPFRQPLQMLVNHGSHFEETTVEDSSAFWTTKHVGRALATLDFDRDGRMDLTVTDLIEPSALLINQTESSGHWLSFQLVGTLSERDAIGARVQVFAGSDNWTQWVTAGDGYLCKNESALHFGVGDVLVVDRVEIYWPGGQTQVFENLPVDMRYRIVEKQTRAFSVD